MWYGAWCYVWCYWTKTINGLLVWKFEPDVVYICLATYPVPWMSKLQSEIDLCPQRWVNVLLPAHLVAISSIFSLFCHKRTLCSAFSLLSWSNGKCSDAHIQIHEDNVGTHAKLANWLNEMILLSLLGGGGVTKPRSDIKMSKQILLFQNPVDRQFWSVWYMADFCVFV